MLYLAQGGRGKIKSPGAAKYGTSFQEAQRRGASRRLTPRREERGLLGKWWGWPREPKELKRKSGSKKMEVTAVGGRGCGGKVGDWQSGSKGKN